MKLLQMEMLYLLYDVHNKSLNVNLKPGISHQTNSSAYGTAGNRWNVKFYTWLTRDRRWYICKFLHVMNYEDNLHDEWTTRILFPIVT